MATAIQVENLSKAYRLGEIGTGTLSQDLERWFAKIRGKEDPFLKIGETNDRTTKGNSDVVWSLKDINFEIQQGDAIGIIGRNGAGKSTLLKLLSRVTSPTSGDIKVNGRIASLLEVGTGFHPELTGRENIYLNGAILGMRKKEITRKFDEIVDFSGVERYVDTPVKRYSSGMYVRLAFAVAAHLESEILIVDEVLAVGDVEFQKKCLGKMGDVSKGEGRTVLFVSHNMGSIANLCNVGLVLQNGKVVHSGQIYDSIKYYTDNSTSNKLHYYSNEKVNKHQPYINEISFGNINNETKGSFLYDEQITLNVKISNYDQLNKGTNLSIVFRDNYGTALFSSHNELLIDQCANRTFTAIIPKEVLLPGDYNIDVIIHIPNVKFVDRISDKMMISVEDTGSEHSQYTSAKLGFLNVPLKWEMF